MPGANWQYRSLVTFPPLTCIDPTGNITCLSSTPSLSLLALIQVAVSLIELYPFSPLTYIDPTGSISCLSVLAYLQPLSSNYPTGRITCLSLSLLPTFLH